MIQGHRDQANVIMGRIIRKFNRRRRRPNMGSLGRGGLGSLGDDGLGDLNSIATTAAQIATDPYLAEMMCHVRQLGQIEHKMVIEPCPPTPSGMPGGIGLRAAIVPMRTFVYAQQHKWAYGVMAAVFLGLPFWLGYELGKGRT